MSKKSSSSGRRLTVDGCLAVSSARREKRPRNLATADGACDSVEKEGLVGDAVLLDVAAAVTDSIDGIPSWLALGDGEADEDVFTRSRDNLLARPVAFLCDSASELGER